MTRRAVLRVRVAVGGEGAGKHELDCQLEACYQYAQDQGWEVVAELAEDERGVSGSLLDRPQLNSVLAQARAHQFDVLIVRDLCRLSRELVNLLTPEDELKQQSIQVNGVLPGRRETKR